MAELRRYVLTATVVIPGGTHLPGAPAHGHGVPGGPGRAAGRPAPPATCLKGQVVLLDPDSDAYAAIGAHNLRPFIDGHDTWAGRPWPTEEAAVSIRVVTSPVDFVWDNASVHLSVGTMLAVDPSSPIESAIGLANLSTPADPAAVAVTAGVSN